MHLCRMVRWILKFPLIVSLEALSLCSLQVIKKCVFFLLTHELVSVLVLGSPCLSC
jgi:hypothetical protein